MNRRITSWPSISVLNMTSSLSLLPKLGSSKLILTLSNLSSPGCRATLRPLGLPIPPILIDEGDLFKSNPGDLGSLGVFGLDPAKVPFCWSLFTALSTLKCATNFLNSCTIAALLPLTNWSSLTSEQSTPLLFSTVKDFTIFIAIVYSLSALLYIT